MKRTRSGSASGEASETADLARRRFLTKAGAAVAASGAAAAAPAWGGSTLGDAFADFFQSHYQRMTRDEIDAALERIERKASRRYGVCLLYTSDAADECQEV